MSNQLSATPDLGYGLDVPTPAFVLFLGFFACAPRMRIPGPMRNVAVSPAPDGDQARSRTRPRRNALQGGATEDPEDSEVSVGDAYVRRRTSPGEEDALARAAARFVGKQNLRVHGEKYREDCSGFVAAVYAQTGRELSGSSADLYARAKEAGVLHKRKTPAVGDLAFFDDTYDRNRNGRRDDPLSHVAVVEAIADDGTIVMVHYGSKGVARITMDLRHPNVHIDDDGILRNSYLRSGGKGDRTAGALFRSFGSLWKVDDNS